MKLLFFFCFVVLFGWFGSNIKKSSPNVSVNTIIVLKDTIDFATQVQPILIKNCSPCHFTGGKMYGRMPFDKDTTIINHEAGILRRIKGEENDLINAFIQQTKKIITDN
ncbi:MAG TPA: hypothetical protein VGQ04_06325 [Chitinophagaceae bacterium]|jgi:hypothetical protein|nr:hypothetical protein [Chitinophagaceae bacterium]